MKYLLLVIIALLVVVPNAQAAGAPIKKDRLIAALIQVESRGNDHAIGDKKKKERA